MLGEGVLETHKSTHRWAMQRVPNHVLVEHVNPGIMWDQFWSEATFPPPFPPITVHGFPQEFVAVFQASTQEDQCLPRITWHFLSYSSIDIALIVYGSAPAPEGVYDQGDAVEARFPPFQCRE